MRIRTIVLALCLFAGTALAASTIDTTKPVTGSALSSSVIRANFAAAASDIAALQTSVTNAVAGALLKSSNLSDLSSPSTARTNLGLAIVAASGSASDLSTGTLPVAQMPALTGGDCTSTIGTVSVACSVTSMTGTLPISHGGTGGTSVGGLIGRQVFTTAGTATYTCTPGTQSIVVEVVGGGGGGGGAALTGAAQLSLGGSGGAGGYASKRVTTGVCGGVTYTVGAKGTGGTAGANNGTAGGTTSFGSGPTVQATGGGLGTGDTAAAVPKTNASNGNNGTGSSGDVNLSGNKSENLIQSTTTLVIGPRGPDAPLYGGRVGGVSSGTGVAGNNAANYGSGGTGGGNTASQGTGKAGGDGTDGLIIISEYD